MARFVAFFSLCLLTACSARTGAYPHLVPMEDILSDAVIDPVPAPSKVLTVKAYVPPARADHLRALPSGNDPQTSGS